MKKRRYHGHSGKRRLLAVMLAMAMLFGMSTISAYADEITGKMPVEQVDVDVGQTDGESDGMQAGDSGQQDAQPESETQENESAEPDSQDIMQPVEEAAESEQADERMAVVSYSGNTNDGTYNDAWTEQTWTDKKTTMRAALQWAVRLY